MQYDRFAIFIIYRGIIKDIQMKKSTTSFSEKYFDFSLLQFCNNRIYLFVYSSKERERERERQTETDRQREKRDRQTDRQTDRELNRELNDIAQFTNITCTPFRSTF